MYEEDSSATASPASPGSPNTSAEPTTITVVNENNTANTTTTTESKQSVSKTAATKNSSVEDILESYHNYYSKLCSSQQEPSSSSSNDKLSYILNPTLIAKLSDVIQRKSIVNRDNIKKGVMTFSKSVAYLSSQLSKGPLSDHDIKWLEIGLNPASTVVVASNNINKVVSSQNGVNNNSVTTLSIQNNVVVAPQQSSPIREGLFKVGESLIEVGRVLEAIEAASERYFLAKKRREMFVEQRDKLLRIAAAKHVGAGGNVSANTSFTGRKSPEPQQQQQEQQPPPQEQKDEEKK